MVLKQRFADGRTNYVALGDTFMLVERANPEFETLLKQLLNTDAYRKDCVAFVLYENSVEPIYKDFPQWIYSDNGKLFMTVVDVDHT